MTKDDLLLPMEMGKLKIESIQPTKSVVDENPFNNVTQNKRKFDSKAVVQNFKCSCSRIKNRNAICKRKQSKLLKEPVLKFLQDSKNINGITDYYESRTMVKKNVQCLLPHVCTDSLCALVDNCNQLKISTDANDNIVTEIQQNNDTKWWKKDILVTKQGKETSQDLSRPGPSCSQQALNPPCDVTIDELASYFETLVHIPKKMSSMAEMMYI